jgi:hypothetical protein
MTCFQVLEYILSTDLRVEFSWVYLTADGQAPLWGPWPDFVVILSLMTIALFFFLYGALSDERTGLWSFPEYLYSHWRFGNGCCRRTTILDTQIYKAPAAFIDEPRLVTQSGSHMNRVIQFVFNLFLMRLCTNLKLRNITKEISQIKGNSNFYFVAFPALP